MTMAGTAMPAMRVMPTGAPIRVPSCHRIFFFRLQGFFPQNVQPDGLRGGDGGVVVTRGNASNVRSPELSVKRQISVPEVVQVRDLLHAEPAELTAADGAGHVITAPIIHLDDVGATARAGLDVISCSREEVTSHNWLIRSLMNMNTKLT